MILWSGESLRTASKHSKYSLLTILSEVEGHFSLFTIHFSLIMFALIDCNNFYASCQRVFEPHLRNKPIVILSNNDGCVIARSNEAKALGIPMGAPAFEYKNIFIANNVFVYSSNYALYGDMSSRVMNILATYSPEIEIYSIWWSFPKIQRFRNVWSQWNWIRYAAQGDQGNRNTGKCWFCTNKSSSQSGQ